MYSNRVEITVKSQEGEVLHSWAKDNAISDDFLVPSSRIFDNSTLGTFGGTYFSPGAFLLPDGAEWAFYPGWDPRNPWAPYTCTLNNSTNVSANALTSGLSKSSPDNLSGPNSSTQYRWKMFYSWTQLPVDLQLKAVGLTGMQTDVFNATLFGFVGSVPANFCPQTLVVLPSSFLVHGLVGATNIPDVLEVSYFISVVGAA
jgi:hypothetical protein